MWGGPTRGRNGGRLMRRVWCVCRSELTMTMDVCHWPIGAYVHSLKHTKYFRTCAAPFSVFEIWLTFVNWSKHTWGFWFGLPSFSSFLLPLSRCFLSSHLFTVYRDLDVLLSQLSAGQNVPHRRRGLPNRDLNLQWHYWENTGTRRNRRIKYELLLLNKLHKGDGWTVCLCAD